MSECLGAPAGLERRLAMTHGCRQMAVAKGVDLADPALAACRD